MKKFVHVLHTWILNEWGCMMLAHFQHNEGCWRKDWIISEDRLGSSLVLLDLQ